jgi:hypothetical protein
MNPSKMPNFLIIGAAKAGTTSLYQYLKQHPQVYMSPIKEPMFFSFEGATLDFRGPGDEAYMSKGIIKTNLKDYCALFEDVAEQKAIGEASTSYLYSPRAAERIRHYIPSAKLVAVLRDPVERAYSYFMNHVKHGYEPSDDLISVFEQEEKRIEDHWSPFWHYKNNGFYYQQLKRYYDLFDAAQIQVHLYEDFTEGPDRVLRDILRFLEVDDAFMPDISIRHNTTLLPRSVTVARLFKRRSSLLRLVPGKLRGRLRRAALEKNRQKPKLSRASRKQLIEVYREDIVKLQDLLQRDLTNWLKY